MERATSDAGARASAFASGLRKNVLTSARQWSAWPGGPAATARVLERIDRIRARLDAAARAADGTAEIAACVADLRAVLEWTAYQTASIATARALRSARRVRQFAQRLGLIEARTSGLAMLADSEDSLIANVTTKNGYMIALAERHPHLDLPAPLIDAGRLTAREPKPPGRLELIARLRAGAAPKSRRR